MAGSSGHAPTGAPPTERVLPEALLVSIDHIRRSPRQPRRWFNPDSLKELAASIVERGVMQPLIVRPDLDGERSGKRYIITIGERRWRAAKLAALREVPVLVRATSEEQALVDALVENLQRENLTDDEVYEAVRGLMEQGNSQREAAKRLGVAHTTIGRLLRVHDDPILGEAVATGRLTRSQAQELLRAPDIDKGRLVDKIITRRRQALPVPMEELRADVRRAARRNPTLVPLSDDEEDGSSADAPMVADAIGSPEMGEGAALTLTGTDVRVVAPPETVGGRELRRMVARARALDYYIQQELEALVGHLHHPFVLDELRAASSRLSCFFQE